MAQKWSLFYISNYMMRRKQALFKLICISFFYYKEIKHFDFHLNYSESNKYPFITFKLPIHICVYIYDCL